MATAERGWVQIRNAVETSLYCALRAREGRTSARNLRDVTGLDAALSGETGTYLKSQRRRVISFLGIPLAGPAACSRGSVID